MAFAVAAYAVLQRGPKGAHAFSCTSLITPNRDGIR